MCPLSRGHDGGQQDVETSTCALPAVFPSEVTVRMSLPGRSCCPQRFVDKCMKPRIFCGILPLSSSDPLPRRRVILPSFPDDQTSPPHIHSFLWKSVPATIFLLLELLPTPPSSLPAEPPGKPKNTGVGSLSLLQRIFLIQESN